MPNDSIESLSDERRKELIAYYKWIVNLALFTLTFSLTMVGLFTHGVCYKWVFIVAWILLAVCVSFNWLIVKRLVRLPFVCETPEEHQGFSHWLFLSTLDNLKWYGRIQNWSFVLGVFLLGFALMLNAIDS